MAKNEVIAAIVKLTPALATQWLEGQIKNRNISNKWVEQLAHRIKTGQWQYAGETIKFTAEGKMLDGQHRCWAVIMAGMPITVLVAHGIEEKAFEVMDSGKRRSLADNVALADNEVNAIHLGAITNVAWLYDHDYLFKRVSYPSTTEAMEYYRSQPKIRESYDYCRPGTRLLSIVRGSALHFVCARANRELANKFIKDVYDPDGRTSSVVQLFKDKLVELIGIREGWAMRYAAVAYGIIAFNALQDNRRPKTLEWDKLKFPRVDNEVI